jgi:hypothetical protein
MTTLLLAMLATSPALAEDAEKPACDAKELTTALEEASAAKLPNHFIRLAKCDTDAAGKATPAMLGRLLAGEDANPAVMAAIVIGQDDPVREWLSGLQSDQRSSAIGWLGTQCPDSPKVQAFFVSTHEALGNKFWQDRWQRGLGACQVPAIQKLLGSAVGDAELRKNKTQFFAVLEMYARNLRAAAIPTLEALITTSTDEEELTYIVNAFADAANVGSAAGVDQKSATRAVAVIEAAGPKLPPPVVEQARTTLQALGADDVADSFATYRWPDRKQGEDYHYGVAVHQLTTCKGKRLGVLHQAEFLDAGNMWPEQIKALLPEKLEHEWELTPAKKCQRIGDFVVEMSKEPLDAAALEKWFKDEKKTFERVAADYDKRSFEKHDDTQL